MKTLLVSLLFVCSLQTQASQEQFSVEVTEVAVPSTHLDYFERLNWHTQQFENTEFGFADIGANLDRIIAIGEKFWNMITNMSGDMRLTSMTGVAALPDGAQSLASMSGWRMANPKAYDVAIKGSFGTAFSFSYTVGFSYNGSYKGVGKYLANVGIVPHNAKCGLSWKCTLEAQVGTPINVGSENSPIAALPINLLINANGKINSKAAGAQITVYGDGRIEKTGE